MFAGTVCAAAAAWLASAALLLHATPTATAEDEAVGLALGVAGVRGTRQSAKTRLSVAVSLRLPQLPSPLGSCPQSARALVDVGYDVDQYRRQTSWRRMFALAIGGPPVTIERVAVLTDDLGDTRRVPANETTLLVATRRTFGHTVITGELPADWQRALGSLRLTLRAPWIHERGAGTCWVRIPEVASPASTSAADNARAAA